MNQSNTDDALNGLSEQARNNIVISFVKAYIDGKVTYELPSAEDLDEELLRALRAQYGEDYTRTNPLQLAIILREQMLTNIEIVSGSRDAKAEERRQAFEYVFQVMILAGRMGNRIKGEFIGLATLESRLSDIEDKMARHTALLEELELLLRSHRGDMSQ